MRYQSSALTSLAIFSVALLAINFSVLVDVVRLAGSDGTASHLPFVPFVSAMLIYQDRERIFPSCRTSWVAGLTTVVIGVTMMIAARTGQLTASENILSASMAALITTWVGGFVLFCGARAARAALFPLTFLCFAIPVPTAVLQIATQFLKNGSTTMVAALFSLTDTPFHRQGYTFTLPRVAIEVADECSGIRSSIALFLTGLLAGNMFLARAWSRIVVMLAILPIAVLKNAIRIVSLTLLAMHVDPAFLTGQLHHEGGIVFFGLALALLLPFLVVLRRLEMGRRPRPSDLDRLGTAMNV